MLRLLDRAVRPVCVRSVGRRTILGEPCIVTDGIPEPEYRPASDGGNLKNTVLLVVVKCVYGRSPLGTNK